MMRSPSAADSDSPVAARPVESRSIHSAPSGFSITSTTSGSSSAEAISGPIAVRNMRMRRSSEVTEDDGGCGRSEEHTSELQSLMRISYAVFCLKKKKQKQRHQDKTQILKTP